MEMEWKGKIAIRHLAREGKKSFRLGGMKSEKE